MQSRSGWFSLRASQTCSRIRSIAKPGRIRVGILMKVLLVGNYEFDGSTSMHVWAGALLRELRQHGIDAQRIAPKPLFGKVKPAAHGLGKWLGYIDRFVIFPRQLRAEAAQTDIVHLCDH